MMELRSYNVERLWKEIVVFEIGKVASYEVSKLDQHSNEIKAMVDQVRTSSENTTLFQFCNLRKDGEIWTPYLQIVEMLIRLGRAVGYVKWDGELNAKTKILINYAEEKRD